MESLTTTFLIPDWIGAGLSKGLYERVGGVIREVGNKNIVAWLREGPDGNFLPSGEITEAFQNTQGLLQLTSAASILNLGVSVIGFTVISHQLNQLEQQLQKSYEILNRINRKIDLGFYVKFQTALDLAKNAFQMSKPENRRGSMSLFL